jgi:hypothetical protein
MLHDNCLLVSLSIGLPPQTKIARKESEDTEYRYMTAKKQGVVIKKLFSRKDISKLTKLASSARRTLEDISLPFGKGFRLIPTEKYFDLVDTMRPYSQGYDNLKTEFVRQYTDILARSQRDLGGLHREEDYPSVENIANRFYFNIEVSVVPKNTAFDQLSGIGQTEIAALKAKAAQEQQEKLESTVDHLAKSLLTPLSKAAAKLTVKDAVFRDTLIGNVRKAIDLIDDLNITQNPNLIALAQEAEDILQGIEPKDLRTDKELRKEVAEETKALVDKVSMFF